MPSNPSKSNRERLSHGTEQPPLWTQGAFWFYGSASIAFGIKDNAFSYLLLIYCNHVLGMPGYLPARAMALALVWDAFFDVFLGHLSDKTSSPLGRRHPYMYAALFVLPPSFYALFHPMITLDDNNSFYYILALTITIRTGTTLFEIPSAAQLPDLEQDYERRNKWLALRYCFGWCGGNILHMVNFARWVGVHGNSSQTGYSIYAAVGSAIIFLTILISSLGTQKLSAALPRPTSPFRIHDIKHEFGQAFQSIGNGNFQALFYYGIAVGVASGLGNALTLYLMSYYFALTGVEISIVSVAIMVSPIVATYIAPCLGRLLGKKHAAMWSCSAAILFGPVPYILVLSGHWPELGSAPSLYAFSIHSIFMVVLSIIIGVMTDSMMADVVEDGEVNTERRSEGLYFAARGFAGKMISGGGIIFAGNLVSFVGLDHVKDAKEMTWETRYALAKFYCPLYTLLQLVGLMALSRYNIDRADHDENLAKLSQRRKQPIEEEDQFLAESLGAEQGTRRRRSPNPSPSLVGREDSDSCEGGEAAMGALGY